LGQIVPDNARRIRRAAFKAALAGTMSEYRRALDKGTSEAKVGFRVSEQDARRYILKQIELLQKSWGIPRD